jgi:hypothetical protein
MVKISRYILVIIGILAASIAIPSLYWTIFEKVSSVPTIYYSCTLNDFMIVRSGQGETKFQDSKGNTYTMSEYEKNLPMMFFKQLMSDGRMPDSINGVPMDPSTLNRARSFFSYSPKKLFAPPVLLNPLFESESGRVQLTMPDDFFRIGHRMEFIDAASNKVNEAKSVLFTKALQDKGFAFPAQIIAGIPTTRKSCDDGYFVKDSRGDLFHIKMVKGNPYVARIDVPDDINIRYIECVDLRSREFYCYLFTEKSGVFVVTDEVYDLQRLPLEGFNPAIHSVKINCDLFHKTISLVGDDFIHTVVVDDAYNVVDQYHETWKGKYERPDGKAFATLFPFQISMDIPETSLISFYTILSPGYRWIVSNLIFVAISIWLIYKRESSLKQNALDLAIVAITGVFGFVATLIFPNKFYS